jgi:phosphoglycerate dehydrogenase-like enzyme
MSTRKSLLIIGRLPCSPLFKCIQGNHAVTHIPTKGLSRTELATRLSSLSTKSYTVVLVVAETQHLYPLDKTLFSPLSIGCLCKVGAGYDPIDVDYFTSRGTWVANNPVSVRIPTAEWCVSLILATVKGLGEVDRKVRAGRWREGLELRSNITGMTLGVVGLGAIGKVYHWPFLTRRKLSSE